MGAYNVINRTSMQAGQPEDISVPLANFDAIAAILNGGIDNSNVSGGAAIDYLKLSLGNAVLHRGVSRGAAPPGSPIDGDLWILPADATAGHNWVFRYNSGSASAFKWEVVGGPPIWNEVVTDEATGSGTPIDLATVGPSLTLSRAGEYLVTCGARSYYTGGGPGPSDQVMYVKPGAAAAVQFLFDRDQNVSNMWKSTSRTRRMTAAAGDLFKCQYGTSGVVAAHFADRWLSIQPVRVS